MTLQMNLDSRDARTKYRNVNFKMIITVFHLIYTIQHGENYLPPRSYLHNINSFRNLFSTLSRQT